MEWYVLFVQTGKEEVVRKWIEFHFEKSTLCAIAPLRSLIEKRHGEVIYVHKFLFPGYIFIKTKMDTQIYYILKSIPGLIKILGDGGYCYQISDREISLVLKLIGKTNIVNCSKVYVEKSKIHIISGPLCGLEGIIKKIDKHRNRAKILLSFMGEPKLIDVGIDLIY